MAFWSAIRARAAELHCKPKTKVIPGTDFALTEVVHCKSQDERGVRAALSECVARHFGAIAALSRATVVVVLGDNAASALAVPPEPLPRELDWFGTRRMVVWLPHPNARKRRTFAHLYGKQDVERLREVLARGNTRMEDGEV